MKTMTKPEREFCADGLLERPRYFPRQLITPAEMTLEQNYFRDKMRRHNRLLHGWGVVCGAQVCLVPKPDKSDAEPWKVAVHPGYILGPYGDEIVIDRERVVDLRTEGLISVCGEPGGEMADPWCSDVFIRRQEGSGDITLYVAVKYNEVPTRPVRVQPASCGCGDTQCEFSRFCDGYEIGMLNDCPESHKNPPAESLQELVLDKFTDCPECPADPWVVLARVRLNRDGVIQEIDNCSCRRIVLSFSRFWFQCVGMTIGSVRPTELTQGGRNQTLVIEGTNLLSTPLPTVSLGPGITANVKPGATASLLSVDVTVDDDAPIHPRDLRVTKPDCSTAVAAKPIIIKSLPRPAPAPAPTPQPAPQSETQPRAGVKPPSRKAGARKGEK